MGAGLAAITGTGALTIIGLLLRSRAGSAGLWEVLGELARGRTAAMAERERRATMVEVLDRLTEGGRLVEIDERGKRHSLEVRPRTGQRS